MNETIEQFIARGGKISKFEPQESPETKHILSVKLTGSMDIIDLAEGADLYSEAAMAAKGIRKVKIDRKKRIKINPDLLPPGLLGLLNSLGDDIDAARQQEETVSEG
jgi:hypothetical protein